MPCSANFCICKGTAKQRCQFWKPSQKSKYARCLKYLTERIPCPIPGSPCPTCEFHIAPRIIDRGHCYTEEQKRKIQNEQKLEWWNQNKKSILRTRRVKRHKEKVDTPTTEGDTIV